MCVRQYFLNLLRDYEGAEMTHFYVTGAPC